MYDSRDLGKFETDRRRITMESHKGMDDSTKRSATHATTGARRRLEAHVLACSLVKWISFGCIFMNALIIASWHSPLTASIIRTGHFLVATENVTTVDVKTGQVGKEFLASGSNANTRGIFIKSSHRRISSKYVRCAPPFSVVAMVDTMKLTPAGSSVGSQWRAPAGMSRP